MIRLSLDTLIVEIPRHFSKGVPPRTRPNIAQVTYSANGSVLYDGTSYTPPYEWDIEAYLTNEQRLTLARLFERSRSQREEVLIEDYAFPQVDYGDQTREEATGASVTTSDECTIYFAKYRALFDAEPTYEKAGRYWKTAIALKESSIVSVEV